jgi:hypothetical protein
MKTSSPFSLSSTVGTADRGARSETADWARVKPGRWTRGGEDERIPVLEVGTGVGYLCILDPKQESRACLLEGRGKPGEEDRGSKAGRSAVAGRFTPATVLAEDGGGGRLNSPASTVAAGVFSGEVVIVVDERSCHCHPWSLVSRIDQIEKKEKSKREQCCKKIGGRGEYHGLQGYTRFASADSRCQ